VSNHNLNDSNRLGEILLQKGALTEKSIERAVTHQRAHGGLLCQAIVELGILNEMELAIALTTALHLPYLRLEYYQIYEWVMCLIPREMAQENLLIPIDRMGNILIVAMADPSDRELIQQIERVTLCTVQPLVSTLSDIRKMIDTYYRNGKVQERRTTLRVPCSLLLTVLQQGETFKALTKNISTSGLYCTLDRLLTPMSQLEMFLYIPDGSSLTRVRARGTVVRVDPIGDTDPSAWGYRVAIFLEDVADEDRASITHHIEQHQLGGLDLHENPLAA